MKTMILATIVCVSLNASAQERENDHYSDNRNYQAQSIPDRVNGSFRRDHPDAENTEWEHNGKTWHAHYRDRNYNNKDVDAYYNRRGRMIDQHIDWDQNQLSDDFRNNIYNRYHTRDYHVYRIERADNQPIFQLRLNLGGGQNTIYTDENGNVVRYRDRH